MFAKNSRMIKLEKYALDLYWERIRSGSSFLGLELCVPFVLFSFRFYSHLHSNGQQISTFIGNS